MTGKIGSKSKSQFNSFRYLPTLDGWRAVSVLAVIYYHCIQNGLRPGSLWEKVAERGHAGVDVFFAISGFLICGKLAYELQTSGTIALKQFYIRRCFRIFPAVWTYLIVLACLAAVGWITIRPWEFGSTLLFLRNYFPTYHGRALGTYTAQFWSLAVEEHFYLFWPLTMLLIGPKLRRIGWTALCLALAVFFWRLIDEKYGWLTPFGTGTVAKTDTRIDALLWGCLMALLFPYIANYLQHTLVRRYLWIPVCLSALAVVFVKHLPGAGLFKAMLFPALIVTTVLAPESPLGRFLESPPMRWIGRLSYSMYIWQQLPEFPSTIPNSPIHLLQHFPYNLGVIFAAAVASYYLVELPMTRVGHRIAARSRHATTQPAVKTVRVDALVSAPGFAVARDRTA